MVRPRSHQQGGCRDCRAGVGIWRPSLSPSVPAFSRWPCSWSLRKPAWVCTSQEDPCLPALNRTRDKPILPFCVWQDQFFKIPFFKLCLFISRLPVSCPSSRPSHWLFSSADRLAPMVSMLISSFPSPQFFLSAPDTWTG